MAVPQGVGGGLATAQLSQSLRVAVSAGPLCLPALLVVASLYLWALGQWGWGERTLSSLFGF